MGFLDRERERQQQQIATEQAAVVEMARLQAMEAQRLQAEAEDRSRGSEDNAKISALLDNLPKLGMEDYFEIVKKHTGYQGFPFLYTRGKDLKQYPQLVEKLLGFGLIPEIRIAHPSETFYGFGVYNADHSNVVKPSVGNLFFRTYLTEPQEPGIGLYFGKCIKHHRGIEITNHVFVRFVLPMHAIITGDGSRVSVANIETLDNALERGFRYPHQSRIFFNEPPGIVGNG